ncbi:hypothetical protein EGR_02762 [Echinococcus granulosus]|uniref:Uncharacterized protein n=1 Tax=Echinococcus granulosus TaxID=6210 RepID=W6V781_ECHGR|nr:hypothetical protein EGR_02762 [Echinococcus granulosus]EUB62309.1 hypothetical protein EGR_02762 [Echinococcus granulosus]
MCKVCYFILFPSLIHNDPYLNHYKNWPYNPTKNYQVGNSMLTYYKRSTDRNLQLVYFFLYMIEPSPSRYTRVCGGGGGCITFRMRYRTPVQQKIWRSMSYMGASQTPNFQFGFAFVVGGMKPLNLMPEPYVSLLNAHTCHLLINFYHAHRYRLPILIGKVFSCQIWEMFSHKLILRIKNRFFVAIRRQCCKLGLKMQEKFSVQLKLEMLNLSRHYSWQK